MPKVLITGASGLLGRALVLEFSRNSWEVCGLAFSRARDNLVKVDLNNEKEVKNIIENFKVCNFSIDIIGIGFYIETYDFSVISMKLEKEFHHLQQFQPFLS